jgi:beta-phosphoglucomutase-like phosphatase (HAD superfamily)
MADTAIFDVDATLVDTNYQHALAWFRAFHRFGLTRSTNSHISSQPSR